MRSRINAVVILAAAFIAFTAVSSAKGVQTSRHQLPTTVLTDGTGPMCPPTSGCGVADKTGIRASLLAAGPGPMCFPDIGCGYKEGVTANEPSKPAPLLLADGTGPMCFPHSGCGMVDKMGVRPILLADGTGPMCFPDTGCGYRNDEAKMLWPS